MDGRGLTDRGRYNGFRFRGRYNGPRRGRRGQGQSRLTGTLTKSRRGQKQTSASSGSRKRARGRSGVEFDSSSPTPSPPLTPIRVEDFLKEFDLDATFGPCKGISRFERFQRARKFSLPIPTRIINILENRNDFESKSIWDQHFVD